MVRLGADQHERKWHGAEIATAAKPSQSFLAGFYLMKKIAMAPIERGLFMLYYVLYPQGSTLRASGICVTPHSRRHQSTCHALGGQTRWHALFHRCALLLKYLGKWICIEILRTMASWQCIVQAKQTMARIERDRRTKHAV